MSTQSNMLNQIIGSSCSKSVDSKRTAWHGDDSNENVIALHMGGTAVSSMTKITGYSNDALSVPAACVVESSDGPSDAIVINRNKKPFFRRKFAGALKQFIDKRSLMMPLRLWTSTARMQWRRRRQHQKNGCSLILYPYLFFTSLTASNTTSMQSNQKKRKMDCKQKLHAASKKQFYPKNSNQSAAITELGAQQQHQPHKTSNNIYIRNSNNCSIFMNMPNSNHNTNDRNGSYNNSSKNIKRNSSSASDETISTSTSPSASAFTCSTIYRCEQKSIRYTNGIHSVTSLPEQKQVREEHLKSTGPPKPLQLFAIDYVYLFKKIIHYLLIVNCLAYLVDGNLSMMKMGAFGAITSNYSIVPSATVAPILLPTIPINRSSDPTAIASNGKNRKLGNSIRIDSDAVDEDAHVPPLTDVSNVKQQSQQHQHHFNHHRTHKNSNNPTHTQNENDESIGNEPASSEQYAISPSASSHHFQRMASQHQLPHSAHHVHSSGAHSMQTNKHSAAKTHHQFASASAIDPFDQTTIPSSDSSSSSSSSGTGGGAGAGSEEYVGCTSCQFREQLKAQNLASIKMHILARLAMSQPPNITTRPPISEHLIQSFYSQNGFRYIRVKNNYHNDGDDQDDMNDMLGDDPATYHADSVSTVAEHDHPPKSSPSLSEHHGSHHHHDAQQHHHNRHINNIKKFDDIENVSHKYFNADNEYNDEFDTFDERGGIVYNPDYYDEVPPEFDDDADEAFYSITDSIYSYPKRKFSKCIFIT